MTEQASNEQQTQQENQQTQQQNQTERRETQEQRQEESQSQNTVPSHRLREETEKRRQAEARIQELENAQQQQEEQKAQEQGEWQEVAVKRQEKIEKLQGELEQVKAQQTRDARYRIFSRAAAGVLLPEAIDDAFTMLSEDDVNDASLEDENSWTALAQRLAERKPYLSDGARGNGSGGSGRPVLNGNSGSKRGRSAIADMNSSKKRNGFR